MEKNRDIPVCRALENWKAKKRSRFFMPGHKGNGPAEDFFSLDYDVTELKDLDDLHNPVGVVDESEKYMAEVFGTARTLPLVNGAGSGLKAALLAHGKGPVVLPRNSHRAVMEGIILSGAEPVYLLPEKRGTFFLPPSVDCYRGFPEDHLLVLLTETYEGFVRDYRKLQSSNALIADEAHGGHLLFMGMPSAMEYADLTVHGAHKTLGSLTQSGLMHCRETEMAAGIRPFLQLVTSTSPSWLLISSLEKAVQWWSGFEDREALLNLTDQLKERIERLPGMNAVFECPDEVFTDPLRLTVLVNPPLDGFKMGNLLRQDFGIEIEMCRQDGIVAILTPFDPPGSWERLYKSLKDISEKYRPGGRKSFPEDVIQSLPRKNMNPGEAFFRKRKRVDLSDAPGRTAGDIIAAYPPGIPIIMPGEIIGPKEIEYIRALRDKGSRFQGLKENKLLVVEDI